MKLRWFELTTKSELQKDHKVDLMEGDQFTFETLLSIVEDLKVSFNIQYCEARNKYFLITYKNGFYAYTFEELENY